MFGALLSTPVLGFVFAAGGAGLAWLWFAGLGLFSVVILVVIFAIGVVCEWLARAALPRRPVLAVQFMDGQVLSIAALTAAAAALAIIIGVNVVAPEVPATATDEAKQAAAQLKSVLTAVSTALAAFVTGLAFKAEDVDSTIGGRVKALFYDAYPGSNPTAEGAAQLASSRPRQRITVPSGSRSEVAVYSDSAIPDWSRENRRKRARWLQKELDDGKIPIPAGIAV